jgi:hypothetical protein
MKIMSFTTWIKLMLSIQIAVGIICGFLSVQMLLTKASFHDFDSRQAIIGKTMEKLVPTTSDPRNYLADAVSSEMTSLHSGSMSLAYLLHAETACLTILPLLVFFCLSRIEKK